MSTFAERARRGIEPCGAEEVEELLDFRARAFGADSPQASLERHEWLFERNPCRKGTELGIWICRRDGRIVGQQAEIPFDLRVDGMDCRGAWAVELMVEEGWRLRGIGPALSERQRDSSRFSVALDIGDSAYRNYLRTGWVDLGVVSSYVHPIHVSRTLRARGVTGLGRCAARPFVVVGTRLARLVARVYRLGTSVVPIERFDEHADHLWAEVSPSYGVLARRDQRALRWRFDECPQADRYTRAYVVRRGRTIGYLVVREGWWRGEPVLSVVDYLARPRDVARVLAHVVREGQRRGVIALRCMAVNPRARRSLVTMGFFSNPRRSKQGLRFMEYATEGDPLRLALADSSRWHVTAFDSDLDISRHDDVDPV